MPTTLESVVTKYLRSGSPAQRTREEYNTTLRKWSRWSGTVPLERLGRKEIREFLDWVYEEAASSKGSNPGRTTNKALVIYFNYGVDTGTVCRTLPFHEPMLWRHILWGRQLLHRFGAYTKSLSNTRHAFAAIQNRLKNPLT